MTACSTFAEELLSPSPVPPALLLRLRLGKLEVLRNNTNLEGEWTSIFSTRRTINPSEGKMERNIGIPTIHRHGFLPLLRPIYGPGRHRVSTQATERTSMASGAANH